MGVTSTTIPDTTTTSLVRSGAFLHTGKYEPQTGSDGALGSGCRPDDELEDGVWFGWALDWDAAGLEFDPACYFTGERAEEVAGARGVEVTNGFLVVNDVLSTRMFEFSDDAVGWRLDDAAELEPMKLEMFLENPDMWAPCPGNLCGVWLYINDGRVTEIARQYMP